MTRGLRRVPKMKSPKAGTPIQRWATKVSLPPNPETGCWLWTASHDRKGYANIAVNRTTKRAHRVGYEMLIGPIPNGLQLDHLCRNRGCVNPSHLEPVTNRENLVRGVGFVGAQVRRTHCPRGHAYDESNTYLHRGMRHCRTCRAARKCAGALP